MRYRLTRRARAIALAAACTLALGAATARAAEDLPAAVAALGLDAAQTRLWREGYGLEQRESFVESTRRYEELAAARPDSAFLAARVARNHWRRGEALPVEAKAERRAAFERSLEWAERSLARDPDCGECLLFAVVARGRLATTVGVVESVPIVAPMAGLIDRAIALQPTTRDNEWNATLGNLYYAASAFYRVAPDWPGVEWVIHARGDKDRALAYIERAVAISPMRVDYRVERGVILTCIGHERGDAAALARGRRELAAARTMPRLLGTDAVDQKNAGIVMASPERACAYQRDGFIELRGVKRAGLF